MAISRDKKQSLVAELNNLLADAKMTAFAHYGGLSVAQAQALRRAARENDVIIKVVKNRLMRVAMQQSEKLKAIDTGSLTGQLIYAMSNKDEVAPAQTLATFAKTNNAIKLAGGFDTNGTVFDQAAITQLAALPGKNELIAQVLATLSSPLNETMGGLSGNLYGLLDGVEAKASN